MKSATKIGFDSLGRKWEINRDENELIVLKPVGHDTDPDSDALSPQDERALLELAPALPNEEDGDDDGFAMLYDRARDHREELRAGAF